MIVLCFITYIGDSDTAQYYHNQKDGWHYNLQKSIQQLTIPMLQSKYKSRQYDSIVLYNLYRRFRYSTILS